MRKLKLDVDALSVESCAANAESRTAGGSIAARELVATLLCLPDTSACGTRFCTGETSQNC